ncbi:MAG: Tex family protein [Cyclobacteriaceae bacterium]
MSVEHIDKVAGELNIRTRQVEATTALLDEGATVPFISRYRKEMTGSLDEVAIMAIRDRMQQLRDLDKRREAILKSLTEQEKLTPELKQKVMGAETLARLEDIYLPYKPKRRTKATIAREKGLEPLAAKIMEQSGINPEKEAEAYVNTEKEVGTVDEALQGARDIIAEWVNEDADTRKQVRELFLEEGRFSSRVMTGKEQEGHKYKDYFEWDEPVKSAPSHRILAMRRGEKELMLMLDCAPADESAVALLENHFVTGNGQASEEVRKAIKDSYKRLLKPSMETEIRLHTKKRADEEAIRVFAENLKQLLLAAPLGQKTVLAIDPGFRTGCKLVCLDKQGKLLYNSAIFSNEPQRKTTESAAEVKHLVEKYNVEAIAIGNGTASRETESFVKNIGLPASVLIVMVNEAGASVYSASEVARNEFPDHDVTVRGAVSIGRRLTDPLAELVKIEPKSIGVGQYQHDVDQNALKYSLDEVVTSAVNAVGVEVNTASKELLTYVSGLGPQLAGNIVTYRNENGPFKNRAALRNVPRMGDKAFEQSAGFLRVQRSDNPLDGSAVHPESYKIVKQMAADLDCTVDELIKRGELRKQIDLKKYVTDTVGLPTLTDILQELDKPGRDPRDTFEAFSFMEGIEKVSDLQVGMKLPGIVTNITAFGAFVDVGVHQDGLVHISHLADKFVSNPADVVSVHQKVEVTVMEVDAARKRISLSLKSDPFATENKQKRGGGKKSRGNRKENEPQGDLQSKLMDLKNKFGK